MYSRIKTIFSQFNQTPCVGQRCVRKQTSAHQTVPADTVGTVVGIAQETADIFVLWDGDKIKTLYHKNDIDWIRFLEGNV